MLNGRGYGNFVRNVKDAYFGDVGGAWVCAKDIDALGGRAQELLGYLNVSSFTCEHECRIFRGNAVRSCEHWCRNITGGLLKHNGNHTVQKV